jgi:hypothetical protein
LADLGVNERIILKLILNKLDVKGWNGWIQLGQDREQWRDLVNMGLKLQVPRK